jgi:arabinogalactan endo-1,4-beta-galactosidase
MILTQTWAIGLLLNSHTVKHANSYGSSHYLLKILFINHTYKIQTKQGQSVAYPLAYKFKTWYILSPLDNRNPFDFQGHSLIDQRSR